MWSRSATRRSQNIAFLDFYNSLDLFPNIFGRLGLNTIGWVKIFLFVFVLTLLWFYISWKSFKSGNTVNTAYLNRIPNPEYLTGANVPHHNTLTEMFTITEMSALLYKRVTFFTSPNPSRHHCLLLIFLLINRAWYNLKSCGRLFLKKCIVL